MHDVVIYCNDDCKVSCCIIIEQINATPQFTITRFDELVLVEEQAEGSFTPKDVNQLLDKDWGYEGLNDIGKAEITNINEAKEILLKYLNSESLKLSAVN